MNPDDIWRKLRDARDLLRAEEIKEYGPSYEFALEKNFSVTAPTLLKLCSILWGLEFELLSFEDQVIVHVDKPVYNTKTGQVNTGVL